MTFAWREFLQVARDLDTRVAPTCTDEARHRALIGRAYYAVFCPARDLLVDRGLISPRFQEERGNLHLNVALAFARFPSARWKKVGKWLHELRMDRHRADYDAEFPGLAERARLALVYAHWALAELEKIQGE